MFVSFCKIFLGVSVGMGAGLMGWSGAIAVRENPPSALLSAEQAKADSETKKSKGTSAAEDSDTSKPEKLKADSVTEKVVYAEPGPFQVESFLADWHDPDRNRTVPVKVYHPLKDGQPAPGLFPVILFSHGLGGSREAAGYLGHHWASHGYISIHLQHPGSDASVWRGQAEPIKALQQAAKNPRSAIDRSADVRFVLDRLEKLQTEEGPLRGRMDLNRIGMSGHSFGAHTTLVVAGQAAVLPGGREISQADRRIKAAVILSPPVPQRPGQREKAYQKIAIPCFYMTGTEDDSPIGETRKEDRRVPFDLSGDLADRYLVIFTGGDHMIFSGRERGLGGLLGAGTGAGLGLGSGNARGFGLGAGSRALGGLRGQREKDAVFHRLICAASTAFWEAYLRGDPKAKQWLAEGGFQKLLGSEGTFEKKLAKPGPHNSSR
jgi:predicted dienelactone hydrolase